MATGDRVNQTSVSKYSPEIDSKANSSAAFNFCNEGRPGGTTSAVPPAAHTLRATSMQSHTNTVVGKLNLLAINLISGTILTVAERIKVHDSVVTDDRV
jgi:hypothetical protein